MGLSAIEGAVVAWVENATGLVGKVILARQKAAQPPVRPYITVTVSPPAKTRSPHPLRYDSFDPSQVGAEIRTTVRWEEYRIVKLQAYTDETIGDERASELLAQARRALGLETVLGPLRAAGLALLDPGDMQDLSALVETGFQGRAALDVRFLAPAEAVEGVTYVETIGLTVQVQPTPPDGGSRTVVSDATVIVSK